MTWLKISNSAELNQFQTDNIVCIHADGNYSDIALVNGTATRLGYCAMADGRMVIGVSRAGARSASQREGSVADFQAVGRL